MTKPIVDDAMVERAQSFIQRRGWFVEGASGLRDLLTAALTEPDEIPVTEAMLGAGHIAHCNATGVTASNKTLLAIFRAMEDERKNGSLAAHINWLRGNPRRKDDPK